MKLAFFSLIWPIKVDYFRFSYLRRQTFSGLSTVTSGDGTVHGAVVRGNGAVVRGNGAVVGGNGAVVRR